MVKHIGFVWITRVFLALFAVLLLLLIWGSARFHEPGRYTGPAVEVSEAVLTVDGRRSVTELPVSVGGLAPRTAVTLEFTAEPSWGDTLFLHPVYSPMKVYANGVLLYDFGEEGTYPSFFADPPTGAISATLPQTGKPVSVRLEFLSPAARSSLSLYAPVVGSDGGVLAYLFARYGFTMILSLLFLLLGSVLLLLSLFFLRFPLRGARLRLPGFMAFFAGLWQFSENTLNVYLTQRPSLLYLLAFLGMFTMTVPLFYFSARLLDLSDSRPLRVIVSLLELSILAAMALQLAGAVPFSRSMYWFHLLIPLSLLLLSVHIFVEAVKRRRRDALWFSLLIFILPISSILELVSYYMRLRGPISSIYQMGLFIVTLVSGVFAGLSMRRTYVMQERAFVLQNEKAELEHVVEAQKEKNELLLSHAEEVRRQRHDLRQHLGVIRSALEGKKYDELAAYLDRLSDQISVDRSVTWCDQPVANALLSYYVSLAEREGIRLHVRAQIPRELSGISDSNLCVMLGNLLENAVEACRRMKEGERSIDVHARVQGDMLTIAVDNSYDGRIRMRDGRFLSRKDDHREGLGLRSVESVARSHGGKAEFEAGGNVFRASVVIDTSVG